MFRLLFLTFITLGASSFALQIKRTDASTIASNLLCEEVRTELYNSVDRGDISRSDADQVVGRCFRYHAAKRG